MKKFDLWNNQKKNTESKKLRPLFKEREIFFARIGENVGSEQSGKGVDFIRPVLVFRKFNHEVFLGIPLTKTLKTSKFYFHFCFLQDSSSAAILSQIRLIDAKRLERKMGMMMPSDFENIKKAVIALMVGDS